jgi:hypothetical protein
VVRRAGAEPVGRDLRRERVRAFRDLPSETDGLTWSGRDGSDRALPSGVYHVRIADGHSTADTRLVLLQ